MSHVWIGIDPGLTGAVAALPSLPAGAGPMVFDTPTIAILRGTKRRQHYQTAAMAEHLGLLLRRYERATVVLEEVHAMPKQGVTSSFRFGHGVGLWEGLCAALKIPYIFVTPQAWKKAFRLLGQSKDAARLEAMRLFPSVADDLTRKRDVGRADALLLALYGRTALQAAERGTT